MSQRQQSPSPTKSRPQTAAHSRSQSRVQSRAQSPEPMEVDVPETQLQKLHRQELVPDLFSTLHDLKTDKIKAKNFDNHMGGIRLKLNNIKQYLGQIPDITESIEERETRIENLQQSNAKKLEMLHAFRKKVESEIQ